MSLLGALHVVAIPFPDGGVKQADLERIAWAKMLVYRKVK
jgi:hypothetical protein